MVQSIDADCCLCWMPIWARVCSFSWSCWYENGSEGSSVGDMDDHEDDGGFVYEPEDVEGGGEVMGCRCCWWCAEAASRTVLMDGLVAAGLQDWLLLRAR